MNIKFKPLFSLVILFFTLNSCNTCVYVFVDALNIAEAKAFYESQINPVTTGGGQSFI